MEIKSLVPEPVQPVLYKETKCGPEPGMAIEFKNVTFAYPGSSKPVLKNVSFKISPGQVSTIQTPSLVISD